MRSFRAVRRRFYRLAWIATVFPTVKLVSDCFGRQNAWVIYGWIGVAHQIGAALAGAGTGAFRTHTGQYQNAFWISGVICSATAFAFLFATKPLTGKGQHDRTDMHTSTELGEAEA